MHVVQVNSRPILPGSAMFEAAHAAGASLGAQSPLPNAALQHAAIPAPLMLQRPQVTHRMVSSHASTPMMVCSLPLEWMCLSTICLMPSLWVTRITQSNLQGGMQQVKARCLVDAKLGSVRLESGSAQSVGTTVHLRASFGSTSTGTTQVSALPAVTRVCLV